MGIFHHLDDSNHFLNPTYLYNNNLPTDLAGGRSLFRSSAYTNNNGSLLRLAASSRCPSSNHYGLDNDYGNGNGHGSFLRSSHRSNLNPNPRSRTPFMYNNNSSNSSSILGGSSSNWFVGSFSSLDELKGNIVEVDFNIQLSQLLLKKFEEGTKEEEVDLIFVEVKDNLLGLMENQLEKFLIEGFFKLCNEEQIYQILLVLVFEEERLEKICTTGHGDHPTTVQALKILKKNPNSHKNNPTRLVGLERRFVMFNGGMGEEKLVWLDSVICSATKSNQKVIICCHLPLDLGAVSQEALPWNYDAVLEMIHRYKCVEACFPGHDHKGRHSVDSFGIHHHILEATLECPLGRNAYCRVDAFSDRLLLTGTVGRCLE